MSSTHPGRPALKNSASSPQPEIKHALATETVREIEALLGSQACYGLDFEAMETAVKRAVLQLGAHLVSSHLNADRSDHQGRELPYRCGAEARYAGRRSKRFSTLLGDMELERAYYHCQACGNGFYPQDEALGMAESSVSPGVLRMIGLSAAGASFATSQQLLRELASVPLSVKQVERSAERLGEQIADDERSYRIFGKDWISCICWLMCIISCRLGFP